MSRERRNLAQPIAVTVRLGDPALRERLALQIAGTPDLVASEASADVLITDRLRPDDAGPVVLIGETTATEFSPPVRALLPEDAAPGTILSVARLVAEGLLVFPDGAFERFAALAEGAEEEDAIAAPVPAVLTPREREVLELLASGASNKAIARRLDVSVHTVKFHVASILRKLDASGRLEAVGIGLRTGLLMV